MFFSKKTFDTMRCDSKQFFFFGHHLLDHDQHFEVGPHQPQQFSEKNVAFFFPSHYDTMTRASEEHALS